jgi:E1A/CREB-binding protein
LGAGREGSTHPLHPTLNNNNAPLQKHHTPQAHNSNLGRIDETRTRLTEQERAERAAQLQRTLQLLVHACSCNNPQCGSSSCRKVRQLFQHAVQCQLKVTGGCQLCKKMWCLLNLHAKSCTAAECPVPRCRELRDLRRRQALRQDKARRAAYQQMLRAQAGGGYGGGGGGE